MNKDQRPANTPSAWRQKGIRRPWRTSIVSASEDFRNDEEIAQVCVDSTNVERFRSLDGFEDAFEDDLSKWFMCAIGKTRQRRMHAGRTPARGVVHVSVEYVQPCDGAGNSEVCSHCWGELSPPYIFVTLGGEDVVLHPGCVFQLMRGFCRDLRQLGMGYHGQSRSRDARPLPS